MWSQAAAIYAAPALFCCNFLLPSSLLLCSEARASFVEGIARLLETVKTETEPENARLVRTHIARFMSAVEELDKAGTAAQTRPTRPNSAPAPISGRSALPAAPAATDVHLEAVQYRAMWLERRARAAEVTLKWSHSLKAYTKAAHEFKKLRGLASNDALPALHEWAGERALTMVEGAERVRCLLLRQDPPVRPIPPARVSGGRREAAQEAGVMTLSNISTASAQKDQAGSEGEGSHVEEHEETQDLERECCICLESFTRDKLLGTPPPTSCASHLLSTSSVTHSPRLALYLSNDGISSLG